MGNKAQFRNYGVFTRWSVPLVDRLRQRASTKRHAHEESTSDCKFVGMMCIGHSRPVRECIKKISADTAKE